MSWMFDVGCYGTENSITDCNFQKGGHYNCYDSPMYLSLTCKDFDDCQSDPCENNGTCVDAFNNVTCVCPSPWGGHLCKYDTVDNCQPGLCFNGATCVDGIETYTCQCAEGFDGESCHNSFTIRLWPLNERRTEGFVEVYYAGEWGFLGRSEYRFNDLSASYLCKYLDISVFGYGGIWTPVGSYKGFTWLAYIDCHVNGSCYIPFESKGATFEADAESFYYRYANSLHCVDSRLINGSTYNEGILQTAINGSVYTMCFDGFDMNAATVVCNHLGFNGAVGFTAVDPDETTLYSNGFICDGSEYSLLECNQTVEIQACQKIVQLTCQAVRLMSTNGYEDEGAVEIFYNGTWGFVGNPGYAVSDVTAKYLCNKLGLGSSGFGAYGHPLTDYDRIRWYDFVSCVGNETHVMQCDLPKASVVPPLKHTYFRGSWLYCFDFNVSNVRLVGGSTYNEGKVQLEINGRWGSICAYAMLLSTMLSTGNVLCKTMGFLSADHAFGDIQNFEMSWMFGVGCFGTENSITDCNFQKGSYYECYDSPMFLSLTCKDFDDCQSDPCENNGTCIDAFNNVTCVCPSPWGGHLCKDDTVDDCQFGLCFNGATCVDGIESYTCHCADGFDGESCQTNIDDCVPSPCKNDGDCVDRINGYICICSDGFEGEQCQDVVTSQIMLTVIVASSVGFLLIVTVIIVCCCVNHRRKNVKTESPDEVTNKPSKLSEGVGTSQVDVENKNGGYSNVYSTIPDQQTDYTTIKDREDDEEVYHTIDDSRTEKMQGENIDAHGYLSFNTDNTKDTMNGNNKETKADQSLRDSYLTPISNISDGSKATIDTCTTKADQSLRDSYLTPMSDISDSFKATTATHTNDGYEKGTDEDLRDSYLKPVHVTNHSDGSKASKSADSDVRTKGKAPTEPDDYDDVAEPLSASTRSNIEYFFDYRRAKGVSTEIEMTELT